MINKKSFRTSRSRRIANRLASRRLKLESLEDRCLFALFTPTPSADDGTSESLRAAVVASQSNQVDDTIDLGEGIYTLRLGDLVINERNTNLRIEGAGAERTVIKISGDARAFDVDFAAQLEMSGLSILRGHADEGGQIRTAGIVVLSDVMLHSGVATQGGAIFNGGDLTLTNVEFVANEAGVGGGVWNHVGATLTANDTRWLQNVTSEGLGALITSPGQVGISAPISPPVSIYSIPPRGATALFNAGTAHLQRVEIAGNVSETGAVIHNVGNGAELRIEDSQIYDNKTSLRGGNAPSVLLATEGTVDIFQTAIFNNSSNDEAMGLVGVFGGAIDLNRVSIFNNPSPSYGFKANGASVRMEHVTYVRSGFRGIQMGGGAHTVYDFTASAMERISIGGGQFHTGGGNWLGFGKKPFDHPTDRQLSNEDMEQLFLYGESFDFMPAGIYQGRVALPPTGTSQLIDALPNGDDAGAFEFVAGMELEASLPMGRIVADLTVQEDGPPLLIDSLVPDSIDAVAAHGLISRNDQGQLVYQTQKDFEGLDRLVAQGADGQMHSWAVVVAPQADPPTIEDYTVTVLGRSEVLGHEKPTSTELTDLNAVSASYQRDSFWPPDGNYSAGPDVGSVVTARGFVVDGELVQTGPQWGDRGPVPYWLTGDVARPWLEIEYVPEPGFSGLDENTVRIVNSSGLSAEATATYNVLDPDTNPALGRVTATILGENFEPTDSVKVGELFYVEYRIDDLRDANHPFQTSQRNFYSINGIFNIGGAPLQVPRRCTSVCKPLFGFDGKVSVPPQTLGNFMGGKSLPTQLDASNLRVDAELTSLSHQSGPFYRVAVEATAPGTITADIPFVIARGLGMYGEIPHDWFEIVTDRVEVRASNTNMNQREDVNQDGVVAPGDVLIVINALNDAAERESPGQAISTPAEYMWDVNEDGQLTPNDALIVVNYLNSNSLTAIASAEGESVASVTQPWLTTLQDSAELVDEVMSADDDWVRDSDTVVPLAIVSGVINAPERIGERLGDSGDDDDTFDCVNTPLEEAIDL
jgi:hypothetical protein